MAADYSIFPANIVMAFAILGPFSKRRFTQAIQATACRHDGLRGVFASSGHGFVNIDRGAASALRVYEHDLTGYDLSGAKNRAIDICREAAKRPVDLAAEWSWHVSIIKLRSEYHVIQFTISHIVSDEWSIGLFIAELNAGYRMLVSGGDIDSKPGVSFYRVA